MDVQIDKYGYVTDLELAKDILVEYFSSGQYKYRRDLAELLEKIRSSLIKYEDGYTFDDEDGLTFGGPEGSSGYTICELSSWLKDHNSPSIYGRVRDLNDEDKVFFEINGELKCFILHELD